MSYRDVETSRFGKFLRTLFLQNNSGGHIWR